MTDNGTLKQNVTAIDRQLIARMMTEIMRDPASDALSLTEIKTLAIVRLLPPVGHAGIE